MKTKDAINILDYKKIEHWKNPSHEEIDEIINLLRQGKKYEEIWEEFRYYISGISKVLSNKIDELEQKYFPKIKQKGGENNDNK